ncbi:MAG: transglutaminase domain-containing protein [Anaerolineales bacterium]
MTDPSKTAKPTLDLTSFFLIGALAILSAGGLQAANWTDHLSIVVSLSLWGVLAGLALGRSRFGPTPAVLLAAVYGVFLAFGHAGLTLDPGLVWHDRALDLLGRLQAQIRALASGSPHNDPLMFVMGLALLYWAFSVRAAWSVFRRGRFWGAVVPLGLALLTNTYLYGGLRKLTLYVAAYVLFSLWLAVRVEMGRRGAEWRRRKAQVPSDAFSTLTRAGSVAAVALVFLAWTGPAFAESRSAARLWTEITRPWRDARDRLGDAFSGLRGEVLGSREPYGARLRLGAGEEPVDALVMRVRSATAPRRNGRFYWRSRVYDSYQDGEWNTSEGLPVRMDPDIGDLPAPRYASREVISFTFEPNQSGWFTLYLPAQPLWLNRTATARILPIEGFGLDVLEIHSAVPVVKGETYRSRGSIAVPLAEELRQAEPAYPEWVVEAYLDVPENLGPALHDLALEITGDAASSYDRTLAITNWLRDHIEYRRALEEPPQGTDPIEWFLFDSRVGYCNYYASAEVLLLRSLGIPARLAVGYARGAFNLDEGGYEVRTTDSHAWPEVFFTGYGWVEFEPTASQSPIVRPEVDPDIPGADLASSASTSDEELPSAAADGESGPAPAETRRPVSWGEVLFLALAWGGLLAVSLWILFRVRPHTRAAAVGAILAAFRVAGLEPPAAIARWRPWSASALSRIYAEWSSWLRRLGVPLSASQTPAERARAFAELFPEGGRAARVIVEAYDRERFGGQTSSVLESLAVWDGLERDLRRLWWDRLVRRRFRLPLRTLQPPSDV